jgi:hypothetical protein
MNTPILIRSIMKNFELECGGINLERYTAWKPIINVVTDQDGKKILSIAIRIRVDGEYYYVRGLIECLKLLEKLKVDNAKFMKLFYDTVDDNDLDRVELTRDELFAMENRNEVRS